MKLWLVRALAIAFAIAAIYLTVIRAHSAPIALETMLGASVLGVLCAAFLWRAPAAAAILNACWIVAAFIAGIALGGSRAQVASQSEVAQSPAELTATLDRFSKSAVPADYILSEREQQLTTIDSAFAFVRDRIAFESYNGILRGPDGTFEDRAGNALDRAMLLAAILQSNKIPVRLVTGQLPQAQAELLFARMFEPVSPPPSPQPGTLTANILDRARRDYTAMQAALGNRLPAVSTPSHDDAIQEIEQHAWVQAQRNGAWVDLDPSFRDSTVGQTYTTVQQTFDAPPVPWMQQVTIRVIDERLENGALTDEVSLETTTPAYQIVDRPIYLFHEVYRPFQGQGGELQFIFGNKDVQEPVLFVGGIPTVGKPIDFGSGASAAGTAPPNSVQAAANAFGTPTPGAANPNAKAFVAEWLEFEISFPGGRKDVTRRVLVDRAGPAWRNAASHDPSALHDLARDKNGLIAPQTLYNVWLSAGKHDLLGFTGAVRDLSTGIPAQDPQAPTFFEQMWPFALRDLSWFVVSDHVIVPAVNDVPGVRFYADSPRIFVWSVGPDLSGKSTGFVVVGDLRRDRLRGIAKDPASANVVAQHKLWFGALEGALETEMGAPPKAISGASVVSTSTLAQSGDLVALAPGAAVIAADSETQARLQAALSSGDTLVLPKQALDGGTAGWWEVAHDTGDVRAVIDDLNVVYGKTPPGGGGIDNLPWRFKNGGTPKGSGTAWANPEDPINKYAEENGGQAACDLITRGPSAGEFGETKGTTGNVCKPSTPAFAWTGTAVAAITVEVLLLLAAAAAAAQSGSQ